MKPFGYFGILCCTLFFSSGSQALAHVPVLVDFRTQSDSFQIEDPTLSQAFYTELNGFPHTYEIQSSEPFLLYAEILVPDIPESEDIFSGIIIKVPEEGGRVTEIARLSAQDAAWASRFEPFGGDTYRHGPSFEIEAEAGTYRIEVHTPDNLGKYVLVVGKREELSLGYFELLGRLVEVKRFFEKSPLAVFESPYVYIPVATLVLIVGVVIFLRKRRMRDV